MWNSPKGYFLLERLEEVVDHVLVGPVAEAEEDHHGQHGRQNDDGGHAFPSSFARGIVRRRLEERGHGRWYCTNLFCAPGSWEVLRNAAFSASRLPLKIPDRESLLGENPLVFAGKFGAAFSGSGNPLCRYSQSY
jgi:hypothetical protein